MRPLRLPVLLLATVGLLLTACGPAAEDSPPAGGETEDAAPLPDGDNGDDGDDAAGEEAGTTPNLRDVTEAAIADAASERGLTESEIEVVRAVEVEWPDGSLGCPQEGEVYTQALVPGYLVVLEIEGEEVYYHAAEGEAPFHCEDPQAPTEG